MARRVERWWGVRVAMAASVVALTVGGAVGCGGAGAAVKPTPAVAAADRPVAVAVADPLGDFSGPRVKAGEAFKLGDAPVGVEGVGVVLTLLKVHETDYQEPGRPKVIETAAELLVQRGAETRNVRIDEGDVKTRLGARIKVERARTDYVDERADYLPRATVVVTGTR